MNFPNDTIISINVTVDAPIEQVWRAWTEPKHIKHWNFASDDWCCPSATNDVREGGKFSWRMEAKDGSVGFDFEGTYTNVIPNEVLEYVLADGRPVQVKFEQTGNAIRLSERFQAEEVNALELQKQGWQSILTNFKHHAENI